MKTYSVTVKTPSGKKDKFETTGPSSWDVAKDASDRYDNLCSVFVTLLSA